MTLELIEDSKGNEVVFITNEDGTTLSMLKSTWDKLEAAKENGTISQEYGETLQGRSAAQGADR